MIGRVAQLRRHPVKGFTPERMAAVTLQAGGHFPCDRLYAVERGPSGFDPTAPRHVSKWRFTGLANHPRLARLVTAYDEPSGRLDVRSDGALVLQADLHAEAGRAALIAWLTGFLGDEEDEALNVIACEPGHRFTDDEDGFISLINLESLRELADSIGQALDPLRLRANIYVDGWPAWSELQAAPGVELSLGEVTAQVVRPIPRCVATHVNPVAGVCDLDLVGALRAHYGHVNCGLYLRVLKGGRLAEGDFAAAP